MIRRRAIAKLSLLTYLWVALSGDGVIVLCIGADGHVALETASVLCCTHDHSSRSASAPVILVEDTDGCCTSAMTCGPCTDLPISISLLPHHPTMNSAAKAKSYPVAKWLSPDCAALDRVLFAQGHLRYPPPAALNPVISSLQTVVLLI
ncbi:MAG: hypothetical protein N3D11_13630 [Candidatus Sumerlaeia bacterium]|nr:hypothetical protein [Candidatus Sumerlaeia bacterium]